MTARVIGLGGKLRSGKDAVADHLVANHGFKKMGMSDALHEAMLALDPWVEWHREDEPDRYSDIIRRKGYVEAKTYPEVRRLLQVLGTEVGRNMIGENVWVDIMGGKIRRHLEAGTSVVVTGIRFENEAALIRQFGGLAAWVERPNPDATPASTHASENGVRSSDFDAQIVNDGTLEHLYGLADALLL